MKEIILKRKGELIGKVESVFRLIADVFDDEKNSESKSKIDQGWSVLYRSAIAFVGGSDLSDFGLCDFSVSNHVDDSEVTEYSLVCRDSYDFLQRALICCLQIEDSCAFLKEEYVIADWVDKLTMAYLYLGKAEVYSDIYYTKKANVSRAKIGGVAKNKQDNVRKSLLVNEIERRILICASECRQLTREDFVESIQDDVFEFSAEHNMGYVYTDFGEKLLIILNGNRALNDLFRTHVYKK